MFTVMIFVDEILRDLHLIQHSQQVMCAVSVLSALGMLELGVVEFSHTGGNSDVHLET